MTCPLHRRGTILTELATWTTTTRAAVEVLTGLVVRTVPRPKHRMRLHQGRVTRMEFAALSSVGAAYVTRSRRKHRSNSVRHTVPATSIPADASIPVPELRLRARCKSCDHLKPLSSMVKNMQGEANFKTYSLLTRSTCYDYHDAKLKSNLPRHMTARMRG